MPIERNTYIIVQPILASFCWESKIDLSQFYKKKKKYSNTSNETDFKHIFIFVRTLDRRIELLDVQFLDSVRSEIVSVILRFTMFFPTDISLKNFKSRREKSGDGFFFSFVPVAWNTSKYVPRHWGTVHTNHSIQFMNLATRWIRETRDGPTREVDE